MARTKKPRTICAKPTFCRFVPADASAQDSVCLAFDEYEVLRLHDLEHLTQEDAARQMQVSRPTVAEMLSSAHEKIADALVNGKQIRLVQQGCEVCAIGKACPKAESGDCDKHRACGASCRTGCQGEQTK